MLSKPFSTSFPFVFDFLPNNSSHFITLVYLPLFHYLSLLDEKGAGPIPRQVECYSCMSLSYQTSWKYLQATYIYPKVFTDRCRDPNSERGMPTVMCSSVCVSLMEPDVEAGVFIGFKHIRGCLDRVLRHGFNQSALRTHRFHQNNHCRTLSRSALFNPARTTDPPALGDVQLCSCYGDRCNYSTPMTSLFLVFLIVFIHWVIN
uniref:Homolog of Odr-2 (Two) n=1 Tax=Caenorhabditis tropicalis TaxID=1561998 RepID=A0A1I7TI62_9PELO